MGLGRNVDDADAGAALVDAVALRIHLEAFVVDAQAAGLELYEVEYADRDGNSLSGRDRYRSLQISQVFLKGSASVALLHDAAMDVFNGAHIESASRLSGNHEAHILAEFSRHNNLLLIAAAERCNVGMN